jgi:hypothetical protein
MLAITERLVMDSGLDWAFCDTDSMASAKPSDIDDQGFNARVETIRSWFDVLNPYAEKSPLLKLEDASFTLADGKVTRVPLLLGVSVPRTSTSLQHQGNFAILVRSSPAGR